MRLPLAVLVGGLLMLTGCLPQGGHPKLTEFSFEGGDCGAGEETIRFSVEPGAISFSGEFSAPSPCHRLKAVLHHISSQRQLVLSLVAEEPTGACTQCLSSIPYSGRVEGLSPGDWRVRVYHQDRRVFNDTLSIPAPP